MPSLRPASPFPDPAASAVTNRRRPASDRPPGGDDASFERALADTTAAPRPRRADVKQTTASGTPDKAEPRHAEPDRSDDTSIDKQAAEPLPPIAPDLTFQPVAMPDQSATAEASSETARELSEGEKTAPMPVPVLAPAGPSTPPAPVTGPTPAEMPIQAPSALPDKDKPALTPKMAPVSEQVEPSPAPAAAPQSPAPTPPSTDMRAPAPQPPPMPSFVTPQVATPVPTPTATWPVTAPVPVSHVPVTIATMASEGTRRFDIRLDPPDLGRIDVTLAVDTDGGIRTHLAVERPETLQLLRNDVHRLDQALSDAGLKADPAGPEVSLRQNNDDTRQRAPQREQTGSNGSTRDTPAEPLPPPPAPRRMLTAAARLDLSL